MANYSQYSPWTDAAAYGRGLGDTLSEAMLKMPMQRAALAQQAAMEQTRQREEAQKLAQTEAYHTASLGLGRDKLEEIRRQNAAHQLEMELKSKGNWTPYQNKTTGEVSLYNPVTGETKPYSMPAPVTPDGAAPTPGMLPVSGLGGTPQTQNQALQNALTALKVYTGMGGTTATNDPSLMRMASNVMAQATAPYQPRPAVAPMVAPTNAAPSLGLTNAPASAMMPGAGQRRVGNYVVEPMP